MSNFTDFVSQVNQSIHSVNVTELTRALLATNFTNSKLFTTSDSIFPVQISLSVILGLIPIIVFLLRRSKKNIEKPTKFEFPAPEEAKPNWKGRRLVPADIYQENDPDNIYCYCPATAQYLGKFKSNTKEEVDVAIAHCRKAQQNFYRDPEFSLKRRKVLRTLNEFIIRNQETIARVACRDSGKTMVDASMGEIMVTLEKINWILNNGEAALKPSRRPGPSSMLMKYKTAEVWYEPRGVVGALVSWNYPFHNMLNPVVAAIFSGNGIVVKCSERVRWSSEYFVNLVKTALRVCDIDDDLVQLICCWGKDGDLVSGNPGFDHLTFIGSIPVAKHVLRAASEVVTPVVVELGGKDAVLICEDYLKKKGVNGIASVVMRGTFQSAGQNCIGIERVIVSGDSDNYERFVQELAKKVATLRVGSAIDQNEEIDMGAMIMGGAKFDELESWVEEAVKHGARLLHGGKRYTHPNYPQGHYFEPTLLVDVDPTCKLATNEVFGPVLCVIHAKDDDEALNLANSTIFGLGGSVFSTNFARAKRLTAGMRAGNVAINDFATFYVCQLPFGGVGGSGYGKFGGEEGLRGLCLEKSVCYDKTSLISTSIPNVIDYPISNGKKAWKFVSALCKAGYDYSAWQRVKAVVTLAKNAN
ncbi:hypothetical protein FOA43_000460 [Brettanomyces nanus]|uniref:Aldehyde dehydrogenase domain-containing protein n=1 Tax=Eeniella nana TaxID=13502 RepID=A0A875S150_EENNA|nr:uncharacterized protein FOA43_000460 [Brettanomyces nanus]QPG73154.1 hypothetical protein FOA43_000460 [Brettanomyces nanus]